MSLGAVMESYDAQMLDSNDADISMYAGPSGSGPWLEADMSASGLDVDFETYPRNQGSIEIDMTDHEEEITEYEMADEEERYLVNVEELPDVDVYDASWAPSPPNITFTEEVVAEGGTTIDAHGHNLASERLSPPAILGPDQSIAQRSLTPSQQNHADAIPSMPTPFLAVRETDAAVPQSDEAVDTAVAHPVLFPISEAPSHVEALTDSQPQIQDRDVEEQEMVRGGDEFAETTHDKTPRTPATDLEFVEPQGGALTHVATSILDQEIPSHTMLVLPSHEVPDDTSGDSGDPLEISDGVYIDPPPAVLLSLSFTVEVLECCLFNLPLSSPSSQNPSGSAATANEGLALVLHDRPTLYYEPLSSVFEALRQEEYLQDLPGFADGELVLDAYDLQLVISEDNVHAHEVSLHDLNVLHDGADLSGALRLQMRAILPRFIHRYNSLRDQIARLDLTADDLEENGAPSEAKQPQADENHGLTALAAEEYQDPPETTVQNSEEQPQALFEQNVDSHSPQHDSTTLADSGDSEAYRSYLEDGEDRAEGIMAGSVIHPSAGSDLGDNNAEPFGPLAGDEGDVFDAEEVHRHADAREGGDYAEYADDDDEDGVAEDSDGQQTFYQDDEPAAPDNNDAEPNEFSGFQNDKQHEDDTGDGDGSESRTLGDDYDEAFDVVNDGETARTDVQGVSIEGHHDTETRAGAHSTDSEFGEHESAAKIVSHIGGDDAVLHNHNHLQKVEDDLHSARELKAHAAGRPPLRQTSTTISTKRGHDEVDTEGDDGPHEEFAPSSLDSKRPRVH